MPNLLARLPLLRLRWLLEPAVGVLVLGLALATGQAGGVGLVSMSLLAASAALSRSIPAVALGAAAVGVLVLAEALTLSRQGSGVEWIAYLALLFTVIGIAAHGRPVTRWLDLAGAILVGPVGGYLVILRAADAGALPGGSGSWPVRFTLVALVLSIGQVTAWLLGTLWRQRRARSDRHPSPPVVSTGLLGDVLFAGVFFLLVSASASGTDTVSMLVLLGLSIALAVRRLAPPVALGIAWFAAIGQMLGGNGVQPADLAILAVLYATAAYGDRVTRWAGLVSAGLGALVAALYLTLWNDVPDLYFTALSKRLGELVLRFLYLVAVSVTVLGLSWVLGMLARTWRTARASRRAQSAAEEERRRAEQSFVVEQERGRIARDMHDVVAHSLAVVIAQADGARYARRAGTGVSDSGAADSDTQDSDTVDEALTTISMTARQALGDVRLLLGELRHSEGNGPQPTLDDLDRLVDRMRSAGLPVRAAESGVRPPLGSALQIVIYRIAQEALTNALRHGNTGEGAQMALDWEQDSVSLTVTNGLRPEEAAGPAADAPAGHGLPGMRERAALVGGQLATAAAGGVFTVSARLPTGAGRDEGRA